LKLLLDTHIWLWLLQSPQKIGPQTSQLLADPASELWLSPISTWEVLRLHRKGRIFLANDLTAWLRSALGGIQKYAPLTHEIAFAAEQLVLHDDPADRFLAATAQVLDLTLVTADARLLGLGTIRTLGNR
jgi:PIN domain nuclease of toxin-antitoxin system